MFSKIKKLLSVPSKLLSKSVAKVLDKPTANVESYIQKYSKDVICAITVFKLPLPKLLQAGVNEMVQGGNDMTAYHVFQVIEVQGGRKHMIRTDKNQTVVMAILEHGDGDLIKLCGQDVRNVDLVGNKQHPVTFHAYFENAAKTPGPSLWRYSATESNCQDFVCRCLQGSGWLTPELESFIHDKDSNYLRKHLPVAAQKAANIITDSLAVGEHVARSVGARFGVGLAPSKGLPDIFRKTRKMIAKLSKAKKQKKVVPAKRKKR